MTAPAPLLYDRTLRKTPEGSGICISESSKIQYLKRLNDFSMDFIEIGLPNSLSEHNSYHEKVQNLGINVSRLVAYCLLRQPALSPQKSPEVACMLHANTEYVNIAYNWSANDDVSKYIDALSRMFAYLKEMGKKVFFTFQHFFDLYKKDLNIVKSIMDVVCGEAYCIVLSDTMGGSLVSECSEITQEVQKLCPESHFALESFNDSGLSGAITLDGAKNDMHALLGCFSGLGERSGCASLTTLIPNLVLKLGVQVSCAKYIRELHQIAHFTDEICNTRHNAKAPYVGHYAFNGGDISRAEHSYHIQPMEVGNSENSHMPDEINEESILKKAESLDISLNPDTLALKYFINELQDLKEAGYEYEAADASFKILLHQKLLQKKSHFHVLGYRVIVGKSALTHEFTSEATIKIKINGTIRHTVAEGHGPISALDHALRKALESDFPQINDIRLSDFKVGIREGNLSADSQIRVQMESTDGHDTWSTMGASNNIIEASWQALKDGFEYKLLEN